MNTEEISEKQSNLLEINEHIKDTLIESSKWAKIIAIFGFVGIGFMILIGILVVLFSSYLSKLDTSFDINMSVGLVYFFLAIVYYFPAKYLYNYAKKIKISLVEHNQELLEESFTNLKSLYKFLAIFMIATLILYFLIFVVAIIAGFYGAFLNR
jgi:hypothetical protein